MIWGYRNDRVEAAALVSGQVVVLGYDPESGRLHWLGYGPAAPHLVLVEVTVESNVIQQGTAAASAATEPADGASWPPARPQVHVLRLLRDGRGYRAEVHGDTQVDLLVTHHPRCAECGELWPCRDERLDSEARQLIRELGNCCAHCGEPIGGAWSQVFFDRVTTRRYHLEEKYGAGGKACRTALAEARASLPGLDVPVVPPREPGTSDGRRGD